MNHGPAMLTLMDRLAPSRILLVVLCSFIAGITGRSFLFVPYELLALALIISAWQISVALRRKRRVSLIVALVLGACILGIWGFDAADRRKLLLPSAHYGRAAIINGVVTEEPILTERSQRIRVRIRMLDGTPYEEPLFFWVFTGKFPLYLPGDQLVVDGIIKEPDQSGVSNIQIAARKRARIAATLSFPNIERDHDTPSEKPILRMLAIAKRSFGDRIDAVVSEPQAALLKGLLLGERRSLPAKFTEDLKISGTSHIVAVSGYNITIVGRLILAICGIVTLPFYTSFWIAVAGIILFVIATGAQASVLRAGIMGVLLLVASRDGRSYRMINALACAACLMLWHDPYLLRFDAGFQLSFAATLGIIYLAVPCTLRLERGFRLLVGRSAPSQIDDDSRHSVLATVIGETLAAQCAVLPLIVILFGSVSLISPLTNALILWMIPYAMLLGFLGASMGYVWMLPSALLGFGAWALLSYGIAVISLSASVPLASLAWKPVLVGFTVAVYGLLIIVWRRSRRASISTIL